MRRLVTFLVVCAVVVASAATISALSAGAATTKVAPHGAPVPHVIPPPSSTGANVPPGADRGLGAACGGQPCNPPLQYFGGPVQHNPRVYLVFWGPGWQSDSNGIVGAEQTLFTSLAGSPYNNILTQYPDHVGNIVNDTALAGTWIDPTGPSAAVDQNAIAAEAAHATAVNSWSNTADTQYIVLPQSGSSIVTGGTPFCGYHTFGFENNQTFFVSLIPFIEGSFADCINAGTGSVASAVTVISTHEYAETATDPVTDNVSGDHGWCTSDCLTNGISEIGDLCFSDPAFPDFGVAVQLLWSNADNDCVSSFGGNTTTTTGPGTTTTTAPGPTTTTTTAPGPTTTTTTVCTGTFDGSAFKGASTNPRRALPGVMVSAAPDNGGITLTAATDSSGSYIISAPCGTYMMTGVGPILQDRVCHIGSSRGGPSLNVSIAANGQTVTEDLFCKRR
ncbi:MAG: hypothetical protein JO368_01420 [Acidimicrobiales bacterium]|nr:hypothetical protein [Acidimicrobiales bacterium]